VIDLARPLAVLVAVTLIVPPLATAVFKALV
jgi:hypothetical protein